MRPTVWALVLGLAATTMVACATAPRDASQPSDVGSPGPVPFEMGLSDFAPGDSIVVTEVLGNSPAFKVGETYRVRGRYVLGSRDSADMSAWCMNGESEGDRRRVVRRGSGTFEMTFRRLTSGYPHISFFPQEGGESFGMACFGSGDCVWRTPFSNPNAANAGSPPR